MSIALDYKEMPIGRIPEDWEVVRLGDVLSLEYGKGLPEKDRIPGKYPVVGSNGIVGYHNKALVKGPGIVVGRKGTIGAVTWVGSDFWPIDTAYYVKIKRNDIDLKWLYYELVFLNPSRFRLSDVVPGLKRELVYSLITSLPPLPEQRKIAEILSTVDKAIQNVDEAIAKTERLKRGLMQELLTKGIGHKEFKDTEIGRIPKEWGVVRLGKVSNEIKYGVTASVTSDSGIPVLRVTDINDDGYFEPDSILCAELPQSEVEKYRLKIGDLVIARSGATAGKVAIYEGTPEILCFASYLIKISPKESVFSKFLFYFLNSEIGRTQLFSGKRGSAQPNINSQSIKAIKIPLPPIEEQQKIAEILSTVDKKLELERKRKEKLERIKKGLMNDLLTGRRRVKV